MKIKDAVIRVVDCETTGLDVKEDKAIEIACVDMNYTRGIIDSVTKLVNPERKISLGAMATHHITDEMVKDAPTIESTWPSMRDGRGAIDAMAAHNAEFDFAILKTDLPKMCTLRIARHLWPDLEKHTNQYLRHYLEVDVDPSIPNHRALGDATVTALVLQKMLKIIVDEKGIDDVDSLIEWAAAPVRFGTCWFGKEYYGKKWSEVPKSYLQWMKSIPVKYLEDKDAAYTVDYYLQQTSVKP